MLPPPTYRASRAVSRGSCVIRHRKDVVEKAKLVLQAPDMAQATRQLNEFSKFFAKIAPKNILMRNDDGVRIFRDELLSNLVYSIRRHSCPADRLLVPHL